VDRDGVLVAGDGGASAAGGVSAGGVGWEEGRRVRAGGGRPVSLCGGGWSRGRGGSSHGNDPVPGFSWGRGGCLRIGGRFMTGVLALNVRLRSTVVSIGRPGDPSAASGVPAPDDGSRPSPWSVIGARPSPET
jgi:hypothetical protein